MSFEHRTLLLLAPRSTEWANGAFDTVAEQINIFLWNECTQTTWKEKEK